MEDIPQAFPIHPHFVVVHSWWELSQRYWMAAVSWQPLQNHTHSCFRPRSLATVPLTFQLRFSNTHSLSSCHNHINANPFNWHFPHNTYSGSVFLIKPRLIWIVCHSKKKNSSWFPKHSPSVTLAVAWLGHFYGIWMWPPFVWKMEGKMQRSNALRPEWC